MGQPRSRCPGRPGPGHTRVNGSFLAVQALNGLASASTLFITASGLSLVFGVTRIVNFAHGSFYMLGAYFAATLIPQLVGQLQPSFGFWSGILLAALAVGLVGTLFELVLLRRIYGAPELYQLLATFAAVLVISDLVVVVFGRDDIFGMRAPGLTQTVMVLGRRFPSYDLFLVLAGPVVLAGLLVLLRKTRFGMLIRAATQDREMVGVLGVNQALLFSAVLFLGSALAGLGGALQTPRLAANAHMDLGVITDCFVVTVVGGMGSISGAFIAALLIGQLQAFGILVLPKATLVLVFVLMASVLVLRPWGLLGRPDAPRPLSATGRLIASWSPAHWMAALVAILVLCGLPAAVDDYALKVVTEVMIMSLFAASLHLLVATGGLVSFGHAAYFGIGAYAAALAIKHLGAPMELSLLIAPIAGLIVAAVFGIFIIRLEGIYFAMLSLAAAQIVYAVVFQWTDVTGGDAGLIGIWPSQWAAKRMPYYYLVLAVTAASILALRWFIEAPVGYTLRAARDSPARAASVGINVRAHRWLGFVVAGAAAGLAGGLQAFMNGSIDPSLLSVETSVDGLVMLLLGGLHSLTGAVLGAVTLNALKGEFIALTDHWRLFLGLSIMGLVVLFPQGVIGIVHGLDFRQVGRLRLQSILRLARGAR